MTARSGANGPAREWIKSQAAFTAKWEDAQAAVRPIDERYGKMLDAFNGKTLVPGSEEAQRYHTLVDEYRDAVRQEYANRGFKEGPPDRFDTPEKILVWLEWEDCARRDPAKVYLGARKKAIEGGLNPPLPTGNDEHDLLTLRQWCQQQTDGKPGETPAVEDQATGNADSAPPVATAPGVPQANPPKSEVPTLLPTKNSGQPEAPADKTPGKKNRVLSDAARVCGRAYRHALANGDNRTRAAFCLDWTAENGHKFKRPNGKPPSWYTIDKALQDHPDAWQPLPDAPDTADKPPDTII